MEDPQIGDVASKAIPKIGDTNTSTTVSPGPILMLVRFASKFLVKRIKL